MRPLVYNFAKNTYFATIAFMYGFGRCDYLLRDPSYHLLGNQSIVDQVVALNSPAQILIDNYKQENGSAESIERWANLLQLDVEMVVSLKADGDKYIESYLSGSTDDATADVQLSHLLELFTVPNDGQFVYIDLLMLIAQFLTFKLICYWLLRKRIVS